MEKENNYFTKDDKYIREMLSDCINTIQKNTNEWQKTIKYIVTIISVLSFLTVAVTLSVFFKYYFTTDYSAEIKNSNTNTNTNTNTNENK